MLAEQDVAGGLDHLVQVLREPGGLECRAHLAGGLLEQPMVVLARRYHLTVDGEPQEADFEIEMNPRAAAQGVTMADLQARYDMVDQRTLRFHDKSKALYEAGIYTNAVISPAVPPELALLRTSYMATHTNEQLDRILETLAQVGRAVGLIQ